MDKIEKIAVVGGTHGNEVTGVFAVKQWSKDPLTWKRGRLEEVEIEFLLANPKAIEGNRRYIDRDLNRCFKNVELDDGAMHLYEECRAKAINQKIGYCSSEPADFVVDLHTTTSNMGSSVVVTQLTPLTLNLLRYLSMQISDLNIFYRGLSDAESPYLMSIGRLGGILVEIGPTPQGMLRADVYHRTLAVVDAILDYISLYNAEKLPALSQSLKAFEYVDTLNLPMDDAGELAGMIHESLQDGDFTPLKPGDPLFRLFDGGEILFEGIDSDSGRVFYPAFINEAAYYDQLKGLSLLQKVDLLEVVDP